MAYQSKDLSVLAYANGFTLWHYVTPDDAASVDTEGYFNPAADMLRAGDIIVANTSTGGTPAGGLMFVSQAANGVVDVNDMTQIGASDAD